MKQFTQKTFKIPVLKGISAKNIEEHLTLYAGYVKNANLIVEKIGALKNDIEKDPFEFGELHRRFGFEYNGIRNHEAYFASFVGGPKSRYRGGQLEKMIDDSWGDFDVWMVQFKALAMTRGIGWAMLYYDRKEDRLLNAWVDEQHLGQLQDCTLILALDMWEHSYVADYQPSGKKAYIDDFFTNLNWEVIEENLSR